MSTQENPMLPINNTVPINTYAHMRKNILSQVENCKDPITPESYYCITCKKSTCSLCDLDNHKGHQLIPRAKIYNLDGSFLNNMIVECTKGTDDIPILKKEAFEVLEKNFKTLREELEKIYEAKKIEIEEIFQFAINNLNKLNKGYKDLQESMKKFYDNHQDFFAVEKGENLDNQSTVFLMKLDMMDICEHQNTKTLKGINNLRESLLKYKIDMDTNTNKTIDVMNDFIKKELPEFFETNEVKDYYLGIKSRIKIYTQHIETFRKKISNGYNETGSFKNLSEVVKKLDAKNKKGIDYIYNQKAHFLSKKLI